mgnify:CR=1 FL=1
MGTLILSCNTGEGHNSCAKAIQAEYAAHGERCEIVDALQFISRRASRFISDWHSRIYRHAPKLYQAGYRNVENRPSVFREGTSVHRYLTSGAERLYQFICDGQYDNIICVHVFPALAVTAMLERHPMAITTSFVATDYTCSPSVEDSNVDCYFIPEASLINEFAARGIPQKKIIPSGLPVRAAFYQDTGKAEAKASLDIPAEHQHLLMMCGSIGCGPIRELTEELSLRLSYDQILTVVCGANEELSAKLQKQLGGHPDIRILGMVDNVPQLMHSADLFLTKPGGLSTSEAAASGLPMVLIDAVAGCEEHNLDYFLRAGMAVTGDTPEEIADLALHLAHDEKKLSAMRRTMQAANARPAAEAIYDWLQAHHE